jgi:hypothetical protein
MVTIEEAEQRLGHRAEVKALLLGLIIGIVVSFFVQLAMRPIQTIVHDNMIEVTMGQSPPLMTIELGQFYMIMAGALILCLVIAYSYMTQFYGLKDTIEVAFEHQGKKEDVAIKLTPACESLGKIHGYRVTPSYTDTGDFRCAFTPAGSNAPTLSVTTYDSQIKMEARIDARAIALARTLRERISGSIAPDVPPP